MNTLVTSNGSDYFLSVGENVITLGGAASLDKVNIVNADGAEIDFKVNVIGTDEDNYLHNDADGATIDAGTGNDYIFNSGNNVLFKYSGGNDAINGFNETSTLQIASGTMNTLIKSDGRDYFLTSAKISSRWKARLGWTKSISSTLRARKLSSVSIKIFWVRPRVIILTSA